MTKSWSFCCVILLAAMPAGLAQEKTPLPAYKPGQSVYVSGVPDRYQDLAAQIDRLERSSPQTYYVVVIRSAGPGSTATRDYVTELYDVWRSQQISSGKRIDPDRSVIIVAALENHQVAVQTGEVLRDRWSLRGETIDQELVQPAFIPLAKAEKYPEALASLLTATNDWIAARDSRTAKVASVAPKPTAAPVTADPASASTGTLFTGLSLAAVVAVAAILALIWLARRRVRDRVDARIKELKASSVEIMDRLDALKERVKLLRSSDPDFKAPMKGSTLALYEDISRRVNTLWDRWLQIMDAIERAQKLAAATVNPLGQKALRDAESALEQKGVLEEIDTLSKACAEDLDRLEQAHESARAILAELSAAQPKLIAALSAIAGLGLPVGSFAKEQESLASAKSDAEATLTADPIQTAAALQELQSRTETLRARVERVATLHAEAGQVTASTVALRRQVDGYRSGGLKLSEDGGNPDSALAQAVESHASALSALQASDPETAANHLATARTQLQAARTVVESVQKAESACERERTNRARETQRLREALFQAESYQQELERDFAPDTWQPVSRNLEQAKALLATFDRRAEEASQCASSARQAYLEGARLFEQLAQQQQIVLRLMSGLGEQLNALISVRTESRKVGQELSAARKQLEIQIHQHDSIVGNGARQALATVEAAIDQAIAQFADPQPDWPAIRRALADATGELSEVRSQVEADIRDYQALTVEYDAVRQKADSVYTLLASQQSDRMAANRLYRTAAAQLDRIAQELATLNTPATALLERVRGVDADLDRAEQLAREDFQLASQSESMIGEATRSIDQIRGMSVDGLMANMSEAESRLVQAEQLHQSQNYEQAIEAAAGALESARWSHQQAMQMAMSQQAAIDADQRRRSYQPGPSWGGISAGSVAAATAAAVLLEKMATNAASAAEPESTHISEPIESPPASNSADASQSSWSNDASQSQW